MTSSEKEQIFLDITGRHNGQIYRVCWGFTNNSEDVKDLYQEVLLNIWKGLEGFRNEASHATWVHKISINTCILWKKKARSNTFFGEHLIPDTTTEMDLPSSEQNPQILELRKNIQSLKKVDKSVILLFLEGLSYKEIAEITGMTVSNVGVRMNRVKIRIKNMFHQNN